MLLDDCGGVFHASNMAKSSLRSVAYFDGKGVNYHELQATLPHCLF